ncbi:4027_t:CDS:10 [Ambispora leptoticha]|uniref:Autophagy-related protein 13 n=1 Tax=Ambispora leptoticha TaxID=144679 RepID=A0A9N8YY23_9GLOM|nr:4027_t:CDS:10 [Ambispora leptoticha]
MATTTTLDNNTNTSIFAQPATAPFQIPPAPSPNLLFASLRHWFSHNEKTLEMAEARLLSRLQFFSIEGRTVASPEQSKTIARVGQVDLDGDGKRKINTLVIDQMGNDFVIENGSLGAKLAKDNDSSSCSSSKSEIVDEALGFTSVPQTDLEVKSHTATISEDNQSSKNLKHLVICHGFGAGLGFFYRNYHGLSQVPGWRIYSIDWLGMGRSSRPKFNIIADSLEESVEQAENFFVDSLEKWREIHKIEKMTLLGHSLGGYLAAVYALKYPERVERLILVSPVGIPVNPHEGNKNSEMKAANGRRIPGWIVRLWNANITPQLVLRWTGPFGPSLVSRYTSRRFAYLEEQDRIDLHDYIYHISLAPGSGEFALSKILAPDGDIDWMDYRAAEEAATTMSVPTKVIRIPRAGHHLYLDNPPQQRQLQTISYSPYNVQNLNQTNDQPQVSLPPLLPLNPNNNTNFVKNTKVDQLAQNFYIKVAQILTQSRLIQYDSFTSVAKGASNTSTQSPSRSATTQIPKKVNKWFNLELEDSSIYKEDIKFWQQAVTTSATPQSMVIEFFLDTRELAPNQILILTDENLRRHKVDLQNLSRLNKNSKATKLTTNIMLESWQLTLSHSTLEFPPEPPIAYKKSIAFFRSLYAFVRLLPAYRLFKRLRRMKLKIGHRFILPTGNINPDIGLDVPIINGETTNTAPKHTFDPIDTPIGTFTLSVTFRSNCDFHIDDDSEAILSSRFIDMDENYFTPTMARYYQEEEQRQRQLEREGSDARRKGFPSNNYQQHQQMGTSPNVRSNSTSPHTVNNNNNNQLLYGTPPMRSRVPSISQNENDLSNQVAIFPRSSSSSSSSISSVHRRYPSGGGASNISNLSNPSLNVRMFDHERNLNMLSMSQMSSRSMRDALPLPSSPVMSNRPNVTLVTPFKSPSLSSSPTYLLTDNYPSSVYSDRASSSPIHRSPSSISLQRYAYASSPTSARSLPIGSGNNLSSSVKSNFSSGSPGNFPKKFSTSFGYRNEKPGVVSNNSVGREKDWNVGGRRTSKGSLLTNRSDDTASDRGSYNSSFFAFTDDVGEFVRMLDTREPLKLYGRSPAKSDDSGSPNQKNAGSVYKSKLALTKYQQLKDFNILAEPLANSHQNLGPPNINGDLLGGFLASSVSSMTSSVAHQQNATSRVHEKVKNGDLVEPQGPKPMTIPQRGMSSVSHANYRTRRSSSLTSVGSGSRIPAEILMQPDGAYSSYPEDIGELRRPGSSSSLHRHYHHQQQQRLIREDLSSGSTELILKRDGSSDEMAGIGGVQGSGSTGSLNINATMAISGRGALIENNNRRDSGGSIGSGGLHRLSRKVDDDELLFAMSEITTDDRSSSGVGRGHSPSPSIGSAASGSVEGRSNRNGGGSIGLGLGVMGIEAPSAVDGLKREQQRRQEEGKNQQIL